jgi:hypothetical protein
LNDKGGSKPAFFYVHTPLKSQTLLNLMTSSKFIVRDTLIH